MSLGIGAARSSEQLPEFVEVVLSLGEFAARGLYDQVTAFDRAIQPWHDRVECLIILASEKRGLIAQELVEHYRGDHLRFSSSRWTRDDADGRRNTATNRIALAGAQKTRLRQFMCRKLLLRLTGFSTVLFARWLVWKNVSQGRLIECLVVPPLFNCLEIANETAGVAQAWSHRENRVVVKSRLGALPIARRAELQWLDRLGNATIVVKIARRTLREGREVHCDLVRGISFLFVIQRLPHKAHVAKKSGSLGA